MPWGYCVPVCAVTIHVYESLAVTKQLYEWFSPSVCLSVSFCLTITPFSLCSHYHIMKFWQQWGPCKRPRWKVKVTEVKTLFSSFWTVTQNLIHIWWWNDAQNLMLFRRDALLFFKVIHWISRSSILIQIGCFWTVIPIWIQWWLSNDAQNLKHDRRVDLLFFKIISQISRSHWTKNYRSLPKLSVSRLKLQLEFTHGFETMHKAWHIIEEVPYCISRSSIKFQGHMGQKMANFEPNWAFPDQWIWTKLGVV